jgi:uncharacterized protein
MTFEIDTLRQMLRQMPRLHRVAFCAATCERLLPNYETFAQEEEWGNSQLLRRALDTVWRCALGSQVSERETSDLANECYAAAPEPGDFTSDFVSAALDAANAIAASLLACSDGNLDRCIEVATCARDTVDMYIQIRDGLKQDDPDFDSRIRGGALMQRELERESAQLNMLRGSAAVDDNLVKRLIEPTGSNLANLG